ncbi:hypothetical protein ACFPVX_19470 [Cohnella faecalis]|uniref:SynChlorMet cassette protein ScmC n=1 Tax=Cohnella faecalis TaxID=2315694 RepID=A0A398CYQ2_9BACL|nr:hypothetical protein [Cohnella faecalis]RIE04361.1 hypothetical protein D3H35_07130 [Cohnella faecalis]
MTWNDREICKIAEHRLFIDCSSASLGHYLELAFGPFRERVADYTDAADMNIRIDEGFGVPFSGYEVAVSQSNDGVVFARADYRITADTAYYNVRIEAFDGFSLKHALLQLYSAFITNREWGLLVHSSCVLKGERAYLFAGPSGAGKSTVVRHSYPRPILSDEASIVKIESGRVVAFNSPFRSDIHASSGSEAHPLAGIQFLRQAPRNRRLLMRSSDGLLKLLTTVFHWAHSPAENAKALRLCKRMVGLVPVYDFHFVQNESFWEEVM